VSSLIFLGFSVIAFLISFGVVWMLVPMVLGTFFSLPTDPDMDADWVQTRTDVETVVQWITPLAATVGLFIFILKVLMVASVYGRN